MIGAAPKEVFQNGELQFRCIKALSEAVPVDAQVTFMDLSVEAEAFGSEISFSEHANPTVSAPLASTAEAIAALEVPPVGTKRTAEVLRCARLCAEKLERPTFGGLIGPYSLAGRIADMTEMMILAAGEPETAHMLLRKTTGFLKNYIRSIKETGAAGVVIAEPAAGLISPEMCQEFSADYLREMIDEVRDDTFMVILHNCGRTEKQVGAMLSTHADAIHVGNAVDICEILKQTPEEVPVMGKSGPGRGVQGHDAGGGARQNVRTAGADFALSELRSFQRMRSASGGAAAEHRSLPCGAARIQRLPAPVTAA